MKNFFKAQFFTPFACKIFTEYAKSSGNVPFRMYSNGEIIEFDIPNYQIFLPSSILLKGKFGKIAQGEKKVILQLNLSEEDLFSLITKLGGSIRKRKSPPPSPTLGDLLK